MLNPPSPDLFYSRGDSDDPRFGDLVTHEGEPGEATRIVIIGIPQDEGVRRNGGRPGASGGPEAFRRAFYRLTPHQIGSREDLDRGFVHDLGDVDSDGSLEEIHDRVIQLVDREVRAGRTPLIVGGGHDISYAGATGVAKSAGPLGLINIDAHLDVRPPDPERHSGTSFRMLIEEESVVPGRFVEFGIQDHANSRKHAEWLGKKDGRIESLHQIRRTGFGPSIETSVRRIGVGGAPWYGTLDLDGVRSSDAPGVSAPMPDGITAGQAILAAGIFGRTRSCKAFDIAELNPSYDVDNRTAKLAALAAAAFISARA